jgi:hypothetical protein
MLLPLPHVISMRARACVPAAIPTLMREHTFFLSLAARARVREAPLTRHASSACVGGYGIVDGPNRFYAGARLAASSTYQTVGDANTDRLHRTATCFAHRRLATRTEDPVS